jgi:hypothetical protein
MITKLTLTMEDSVIDSAKKYARQKGKSLSDIVENYLKSIATSEDTTEKLSPKVIKMMGLWLKNINYRDEAYLYGH